MAVTVSGMTKLEFVCKTKMHVLNNNKKKKAAENISTEDTDALEAATFLEASGWRACRITRGLLMHSVYELLPRHFSSDETDC